MKTYRLIYDSECPLCKAYTSAFEKNGLLKKGERISFREAESMGFLCKLNLEKARHEIPLIDMETGNVIYGIDSLTTVLDRKYHKLSRIARVPVIRSIFTLLYQFISRNRRVIPIVPHSDGRSYFGPDLHRGYRSIYFMLAGCIAFWISYNLGEHMSSIFRVPDHAGWKMVMAVAPGWICQVAFAAGVINSPKMRWDYLGHLFTVMLLGVLVLLPYQIVNHYFHIPGYWAWISIAISNILMCSQHVLRIRALKISYLFFWSWWIFLAASFISCLYIFSL